MTEKEIGELYARLAFQYESSIHEADNLQGYGVINRFGKAIF